MNKINKQNDYSRDMGAFTSLSTGGRVMVWVSTGFVTGMALANWIHLNSVIDYEEQNKVQARTGSTSNTTMRDVNRGVFWIFLVIFLIASYYLFFPSKTATAAEKAFAQPRSLTSVVRE